MTTIDTEIAERIRPYLSAKVSPFSGGGCIWMSLGGCFVQVQPGGSNVSDWLIGDLRSCSGVTIGEAEQLLFSPLR